MHRRDFLKQTGTMGACLGLGLGSSSFLAEGLRKNEKPNIVYIFADQLRYESCGYAGDTKAMTPNLDRMAAEGADLFNMVSNMPVCAAYRASLFTGKYASSHGLIINEYRLNPNQPCLGHALTDNGYETGYIGKWHLYAPKNGTNRDAKRGPIPAGPDRLGFDGYWAASGFNHLSYQAWYYTEDETEPRLVNGYEPDVQTDMAIEFIKQKKDSGKSFSLVVSYGPPHDPWRTENVPKEWLDKFKDVEFTLPDNYLDSPDPYMDRETNPQRWKQFWTQQIPEMMRVYYAMTANIDWNVGRIMKTLKDNGLDDDTIVVFSSDHGEMFGQNGRIYKLTFYEASARVPFLVRWPGKIPAGTKLDTCAGTVDIMPTLLGLADLPIPNSAEGMDLSPLLQGKKEPEPEAAFLQGMGHTYIWKNGFEWRAVRDKRYTYAKYRIDGKELLFDNQKDPGQLKNVIDDPNYTKEAKRLRTWMKKKMASLNDTFEDFTWYREHWFDQRWSVRGARG